MTLTHVEVGELSDQIIAEIERAVIGKRNVLEMILLGLLADGHVLIDDVPGLAKTLMARSFASVLGLGFGRVQFTPDLVPSDITGATIYDQHRGAFEFRRGPVFTNILLADEINRAPAKTQAALLEAMEERQVTIEGETYPLPPPFLVLATQNPIEFEGTYPLPEAQLDRFLMRIGVGYPTNDDEWRIIERRLQRKTDVVQLTPVVGPSDLEEMKASVEDVFVSEAIGRYIVSIVDATRSAPRVQVGASPRGSLALVKLARAKAVLAGRDFVTPEDVKAVAARARGRAVTRRPSPKLAGFASVAAIFLVGALATGRPELVVMAAPFAVILVAGLLTAEPPVWTTLSLDVERDRLVEDEAITLDVCIATDTDVERVEVVLPLPGGVAVEDGDTALAFHLARDRSRDVTLRLRFPRWGVFELGDLYLRAHDRFDLFRYDDRLDAGRPIRVFPRTETLRALVRPAQTQLSIGNQVARRVGQGIEFAGLRPFVPGDVVRSIDPKTTARRGSPWVREHHPERNADVVLFLDTFSDVRTGRSTTVERAVRAAASIVSVYLERRDRVGLVSFGGVLRWLMPGMGIRQEYRIIEALLDTEVAVNYAWKGINVIPIRTLPPKALVLAVTPLLDERSLGALFDLRGRAFDVAVIDVSPVPTEPSPSDDPVSELAHRIWMMERETLHRDLRRVGISVAEWRDGDHLQRAVWGVEASRRGARLRYA